VIDEEAKVLAMCDGVLRVHELNNVVTDIALDRNITKTDALAAQDPSANEPVLIWEDVRQAAAQPRK
jgi:hypothetical protein